MMQTLQVMLRTKSGMVVVLRLTPSQFETLAEGDPKTFRVDELVFELEIKSTL